MARQLLEQIVPDHWTEKAPPKPSPGGSGSGAGAGTGFYRVRWLQGLNDLINRPVTNRGTATSNTATNTNGTIVSTGTGIPTPLQPKRYGEFTLKARATYNINATGVGYVYVVRTLGTVPANGAPMNPGDVVVSGDAFTGGSLTVGVNQSAAFSFLDSGLDQTKRYVYYFAVKAPLGSKMNLVNNSQLLVMERS